jgi:hypothetical protein
MFFIMLCYVFCYVVLCFFYALYYVVLYFLLYCVMFFVMLCYVVLCYNLNLLKLHNRTQRFLTTLNGELCISLEFLKSLIIPLTFTLELRVCLKIYYFLQQNTYFLFSLKSFTLKVSSNSLKKLHYLKEFMIV